MLFNVIKENMLELVLSKIQSWRWKESVKKCNCIIHITIFEVICIFWLWLITNTWSRNCIRFASGNEMNGQWLNETNCRRERKKSYVEINEKTADCQKCFCLFDCFKCHFSNCFISKEAVCKPRQDDDFQTGKYNLEMINKIGSNANYILYHNNWSCGWFYCKLCVSCKC